MLLNACSSTSFLSRGPVLALLFASVLTACGGGGGSDAPAPGTARPTDVIPPAPPSPTTLRWVSSAAQTDLAGGADTGLDGPLLAVDPTRPRTSAALSPAQVDSTSVRIFGGKVDATLGTLEQAGPRFVVYDAAVRAGEPYSYSLYKLALDAVGTSAPVAERLSSEETVCGSVGARFTVIGQSLSGDEALLTYLAPNASGACGAEGLPRLVKLSMGRSSTPVRLPSAAQERLTPIGVVHGGSGQVAAVLAWQNGRYVRTDASLANPVALPAADVAGSLDAQAAPSGPGIVTRFGIFIKSADGLRRYDKPTGKVSPLLLSGQVGAGAQVSELFDEQSLYITVASTTGALDLYRIDDRLSPTVTKINTDGPLHPWGFRLLKSHVLYAVNGRDDLTAWRKADGQRRNVLTGKRVVMSSLLSDRVWHTRTDSLGGTVLAVGELDGGAERDFGNAQLLSGAVAPQISPFSRSLRTDGAFSEAVILVPVAGRSDLSGAGVRWVSFDASVADIEAGALPATTAAPVATARAPGVIGDAGLFSVPKAGTSESEVFVSRRAAASLARVANGAR